MDIDKHGIDSGMKLPEIVVAGPLTVCKDHTIIREFYDNIIAICGELCLTAHCSHRTTDPYTHPHVDPAYIYQQNKRLVSNASLVVAYVGEPSLGVGQELEIAASNDVPVILLVEHNTQVSRMALGSPSVTQVIRFGKFAEALDLLKAALQSGKYDWRP